MAPGYSRYLPTQPGGLCVACALGWIPRSPWDLHSDCSWAGHAMTCFHLGRRRLDERNVVAPEKLETPETLDPQRKCYSRCPCCGCEGACCTSRFPARDKDSERHLPGVSGDGTQWQACGQLPQVEEILAQLSVSQVEGIVAQPSVPQVEGIVAQPSVPQVEGIVAQPSVPQVEGIVAQPSVPQVEGIVAQLSVSQVEGIVAQLSVSQVEGIVAQLLVPRLALTFVLSCPWPRLPSSMLGMLRDNPSASPTMFRLLPRILVRWRMDPALPILVPYQGQASRGSFCSPWHGLWGA
ncbi:uncharacterized protein LOC134740056 [Pongo pygmaeus]|uniref:uncharacterized protein LOC134740056 n=1 Tax=Pongo pygmaeus TaxID=9600 RepID=UPI00300CF8E6